MTLRGVMVLVHRCFRLFLAVFLAIAGLTGAVISWDHEIDASLNPELYHAQSRADAPLIPALELANRLEQDDARLRVAYLALAHATGETLLLFVKVARIQALSGLPTRLISNGLESLDQCGAGRAHVGARPSRRLA